MTRARVSGRAAIDRGEAMIHARITEGEARQFSASILLVDDDVELCELLRRVLHAAGDSTGNRRTTAAAVWRAP